MAKSYRELMVWQRAIELSVALYQLTRGFPVTSCMVCRASCAVQGLDGEQYR